MSPPMRVTASDISKTYPGETGPLVVLDGVSLRLEPGETLALTGESGSGKSTLLHLMAALDIPDSGAIHMGETDVTALDDRGRAALRRDTLGIVFQQFNLIPSLTVGGNLAFQAQLAGREDPAWIAEVARRLGLSQQLQKFPEALSGGQQQRVAIGRAIASRPAVILADEPTGNLDEATSDAVMDLLLSLVADTGAGLMIVTHSSRLAARMDRRLHLSAGRLT